MGFVNTFKFTQKCDNCKKTQKKHIRRKKIEFNGVKYSTKIIYFCSEHDEIKYNKLMEKID